MKISARKSSAGLGLALGAALVLQTPGLHAQDATNAQAAQDNAPDTDSSPYHQALLNYKSGNYAAARVAIDEAETEKPNDLAVAVLKGRILTEQHDFADGETLLRRYLGPNGPPAVQLALGDLFLRARDFSHAANLYDQALASKPGDPDIMLKLIYAKISLGNLVAAGKLASLLKPLDPVNPAYYFAKAALSNATGDSAAADEDIETVRTIYGSTVANRYLKIYLAVFSARSTPAGAPLPSTNAAPNHA
jgi:predicted Zn-dependent protease